MKRLLLTFLILIICICLNFKFIESFIPTLVYETSFPKEQIYIQNNTSLNVSKYLKNIGISSLPKNIIYIKNISDLTKKDIILAVLLEEYFIVAISQIPNPKNKNDITIFHDTLEQIGNKLSNEYDGNYYILNTGTRSVDLKTYIKTYAFNNDNIRDLETTRNVIVYNEKNKDIYPDLYQLIKNVMSTTDIVAINNYYSKMFNFHPLTLKFLKTFNNYLETRSTKQILQS